MLVFTTVLWGGTFVVIKNGLGEASPLLFLSLRFAFAFLLGCAVWFGRIIRITRQALIHGVVLGVFMFGGYGSQTFGLAYTTVAKSSLFTYTFALITPALQFLILKKRLRTGNLLGLLVVLGGMYLFTAPSSSSLNLGDWVTLGGAGLFAFYVVLLDRYSNVDDPAQLTVVQFAVTSILALAGSLLLEPRRFIVWNGKLFFALAYLGILGSVVAIFLMNRYQKETSPTKAVLIYALEPVFTVIFGYIFLAEILQPYQIAGGFLILAGVVVSELWMLRPLKN
jgi:drug/metabolite transporter (DMT)-like permease